MSYQETHEMEGSLKECLPRVQPLRQCSTGREVDASASPSSIGWGRY